MDELIKFMRDKTHLGRLTAPELREVLLRLNDGGWDVVRRVDGAVVEPDIVLDPLPEIPREEFTPHEPVGGFEPMPLPVLTPAVPEIVSAPIFTPAAPVQLFSPFGGPIST
jgi:hypothetical protein